MAEVTIKIDGIESSFPLEYMGNSILDGALLQGADLPYACKGGVCCTCKAKLLEGQVDMDVVYGLEPEEIAAGYILTCQSHPRTPVVKVDYDV
jgi:ring-1,2-phenylacetyl-CoA epoxidase subunit PaaE